MRIESSHRQRKREKDKNKKTNVVGLFKVDATWWVCCFLASCIARPGQRLPVLPRRLKIVIQTVNERRGVAHSTRSSIVARCPQFRPLCQYSMDAVAIPTPYKDEFITRFFNFSPFHIRRSLFNPNFLFFVRSQKIPADYPIFWRVGFDAATTPAITANPADTKRTVPSFPTPKIVRTASKTVRW